MQTIRRLERGDWDQWRPLWDGYLESYRAEVSEDVTRNTFAQLADGKNDMFGLLAVGEQQEGIGLVHCVVHPTTWSQQSCCYLEDLYVSPPARGSDLGRSLLEEAKRMSDEQGAERLYWHTQEYNGRARSLYDQVARPTSFIVYEM
jgi:GNAT superfamily N-acetyltransferase